MVNTGGIYWQRRLDRRPRIQPHGFDTIQPDPPHFRFPHLIAHTSRRVCTHTRYCPYPEYRMYIRVFLYWACVKWKCAHIFLYISLPFSEEWGALAPDGFESQSKAYTNVETGNGMMKWKESAAVTYSRNTGNLKSVSHTEILPV